MKTLFNLTVIAFALLLCFGCTEICDPALNDEVGDEYFTVEYRTASGENYLESIYNKNNIVVYRDPTGGKSAAPNLELIQPGYENGKFGPFRYTEDFISPLNGEVNTIQLYGEPYKIDYFIKKDTYGQDTISLEFLMAVDECNHFWRYIRFAINGVPQTQFDLDQQAEIVITE